MPDIFPVILAGGLGSRLWPVSRKTYPKQFSNLFGDLSLFQQCAQRFSLSKLNKFKPPLVVTNKEFRFIVSEQLEAINIEDASILIEPEGKNTAPAILAAALTVYDEKKKDQMILCTPSDHLISDSNAFDKIILKGIEKASSGCLVNFGIPIDRAETGYGYIQFDKPVNNDPEKAIRFIEKPNSRDAQEMANNPCFLWNAGIFLFQVKDIMDSYRQLMPKLFDNVYKSVNSIRRDLNFLRLEENSWAECDDISIDHAIMEQTDNLFTVPFRSPWSDMGDWEAVWKMEKDSNGLCVSQNSTAIECNDVLLRAESKEQEIIGLGLKNIIAIAMPDAVLVANKDRAQEVKTVVKSLKAKGIPQAEVFPKSHRPWGHFEVLTKGDGFQVKQITVKVGGALSMQSHDHRSEHWVVVRGIAKVTLDDNVQMLKEGESIYIPMQSKHRLENPGEKNIELIEVQIGSYLEEDDIIRFEDVYKRSEFEL